MASQIELWYPVKPWTVVQTFGNDPAYYSRFNDPLGNPEKGHMGIDLEAPHATPLYSPCDGQAVYKVDSHGGAGIYIYTGDYCVILWHLCTKDDVMYKPLIPTDGTLTQVKVGQLIGFTDNSGAPFESSGDHLHLGLLPVNALKLPLKPGNGFGGCIDPSPYFNGYYAVDSVKVVGILQALISLYQKLIQIIKK